MHKNTSYRNLILLNLLLVASLSSCSTQKSLMSTQSAKKITTLEKVATTHDQQAILYENILLGRIAAGQNKYRLALEYYLDALTIKPNIEIAREALLLSEKLNDDQSSKKIASIWIKLDSDAIAAWRLLTFYSIKEKQLKQSQELIAQVIRIETNHGELFNFFGQTTYGDNLQQALLLFESIEDVYPNVPEIILVLAHIELKQEKWLSAIELSATVIEQHPTLNYAWTIHGIALESNENFSEAIKHYKKAILQFPDSLSFRQSLGQLHYSLNQFADSREQFNTVLKEQPSDKDAQYMIAASYFSEEKYRKSREFFEPLLRVKRHRNAVLYYLGEIARKDNDSATAIKLYRQITASRYYETAHILVAQLLQNLGKAEDALNYLKKVAVNDTDITLKYVRAIAAANLEETDFAISEFRAILVNNPNHLDAMNALGYTLADNNLHLSEALQLVKHAYNIEPNNAAIVDSMGWVHFKLGDYQLALEYLQKAYSLNKSDEIAAHLGEALWVLEQKQLALEILSHAYQEAPESKAIQSILKKYDIELSLQSKTRSDDKRLETDGE